MLGLCCFVSFSLVAASGGYSLVVCRLLMAVPSPVVERRLSGTWASVALHMGSAILAHRLHSVGSVLWHTGFIALRHVGSFQIRD